MTNALAEIRKKEIGEAREYCKTHGFPKPKTVFTGSGYERLAQLSDNLPEMKRWWKTLSRAERKRVAAEVKVI